MRYVTAGHETESEIGHSIDLGSFSVSLVTEGHVIECEVGVSVLHIPTSLSIS